MSPRIFISALLLIAVARAQSQDAAPSSPPVVALDELIARALQSNPQPQIAAANFEAARARAQSARASLGPTLQVVPGIGGNAQSRDEEIILSQPIDLFGGRRANRAVFDAQLRGAQAQRDGATRALIIAVKTAAAELFAAQEAESLGQTQLEIAQSFRDAAARRAELGDVPAVQTQRAQLELDRAAIELDAARAQRSIRRVRLNQLIGQAPETPLRVSLPDVSFAGLAPSSNPRAETIPRLEAGASPAADTPTKAIPRLEAGANPATDAPTETNPRLEVGASPAAETVPASSQVGADLIASRAALLPRALGRPDVLSAQSAVEVARAQAKAIAASRRPQLEIQARRGGVFDGASTSLRAVFTAPLFDLGAIKGQQRAAEFEAQAQQKQVELLRSQVAAQLESAFISLDQNRALVARYRDSLVPQTLDLLRKTQLGYAAGASTFLEVLEAQRATKQIQTEYLQALAGVRAGEADLDAALGADYIVPSSAIANPQGLDAPPDVAAPGTVPDDVVPAR